MIMLFYLIKEVTNMTILNCSATKCIYNDNKLCSRGDIEITGDNAHQMCIRDSYKVLHDEQSKQYQNDSDRKEIMLYVFIKSTCS